MINKYKISSSKEQVWMAHQCLPPPPGACQEKLVAKISFHSPSISWFIDNCPGSSSIDQNIGNVSSKLIQGKGWPHRSYLRFHNFCLCLVEASLKTLKTRKNDFFFIFFIFCSFSFCLFLVFSSQVRLIMWVVSFTCSLQSSPCVLTCC